MAGSNDRFFREDDGTVSGSLVIELATYDQVVKELIFGHLGDYVIIKGSGVIEILPASEGMAATVARAYELLGNVPFLCQEIRRPEDLPPVYIHRLKDNGLKATN